MIRFTQNTLLLHLKRAVIIITWAKIIPLKTMFLQNFLEFRNNLLGNILGVSLAADNNSSSIVKNRKTTTPEHYSIVRMRKRH